MSTTYHGEHCIMYRIVKSSCHTSETNVTHQLHLNLKEFSLKIDGKLIHSIHLVNSLRS